MSMSFQRLAAFLLALMLTLCCVSAGAETAAWQNSTLIGSVTADTNARPQDDFYLSVNRDWLASAVIAEGEKAASAFSERTRQVRESVVALLAGEPQESGSGKLVQALYNDFIDMDRRNELGLSPVMPYVEAIRSIQSLDELSAHLLRKDQVDNMLYGVSIMSDLTDSTHNAVYVGGRAFMLGDADEYRTLTEVGKRKKQAYDQMLQKLLLRTGYTQEEAQHIIELCFEIETKMAEHAMGNAAASSPDVFSKIYNPVTLEELKQISPAFPIADIVSECTERGVDRFILTDPDDLANMNALYTEENVEAFKAFLLCKTLRAACSYLDQEAIDINDESASILSGIPIHSVVENDAFQGCSAMLSMAIAQMYVENYVTEKTKTDIANMVYDVVDVYKTRLQKIDWLSETTRAAAIAKLDNLTLRIAYPDDWSPYGYGELQYQQAEDGGTLLKNVLAITQHRRLQTLDKVKDPIDHSLWIANPQDVNAYYSALDNSINILAGILGGVFYDPDASYEENLGSIGVVIGHEITHAFDTVGSQYDARGNLANWWTDEDRAAFSERTAKVADYFSAIETLPGQYVNGQLTIGETVADLGGMSCMLEIASKRSDFDYAAFFTSYARLWIQSFNMEVAQLYLQIDNHAPAYLRANVTVQQFQQFYDTFDVQEGDGMYLAPEKRLSVW